MQGIERSGIERGISGAGTTPTLSPIHSYPIFIHKKQEIRNRKGKKIYIGKTTPPIHLFIDKQYKISTGVVQKTVTGKSHVKIFLFSSIIKVQFYHELTILHGVIQ